MFRVPKLGLPHPRRSLQTSFHSRLYTSGPVSGHYSPPSLDDLQLDPVDQEETGNPSAFEKHLHRIHPSYNASAQVSFDLVGFRNVRND